jgi:hypothetical protein
MDCPEDITKKVLARVHDLVIPSLLNPLMLAGAGQRLVAVVGRRLVGAVPGWVVAGQCFVLGAGRQAWAPAECH